MEMERGSIPQVNAEARSRRMCYGEYVGAAYYPVTIVQVMPGGGRILRTAPVPEPVTAERPLGADPVEQLQKEKKPEKPKKERQCVVCGRVLGRYQRKCCSDGCADQVKKERYKAAPREPYVSTTVREDRPCAICGRVMTQVTRGKKYCSPDCKAEAGRRQQREYQKKNAVARYCTMCGDEIQGLGRIYCPKCTGEGYRRKSRERERKRRMERAGADGARDTE